MTKPCGVMLTNLILLGLEALRIIASTHRVRSMNGEVVKDIICQIPAHHLLLLTGFHQLTVGFLG